MNRQASSNIVLIVAGCILLGIASPLLAAADSDRPVDAPSRKQGGAMSFTIASTSFSKDGPIPKKFSCDGSDVSPELSWIDTPAGTESLALIVDDPDAPAGTWTHWVLFDLPAATSSLPEGVPKVDELPTGGRQGRNDFRKIGYGGPCPPPGKPHHYYFRLYALDRRLNLQPGCSRSEVETAMKKHILGKAEVAGTFQH